MISDSQWSSFIMYCSYYYCVFSLELSDYCYCYLVYDQCSSIELENL